MDRILYCIAFEHDWRWTLAAGLTCVIGIGTALRLLVQAKEMSGPRRRDTSLLAAFVAGLAIFSTHFLAMQGYQPGGEIRYGVWMTIGSFATVLVSFAVAAVIGMTLPGRVSRALGGVLAMRDASSARPAFQVESPVYTIAPTASGNHPPCAIFTRLAPRKASSIIRKNAASDPATGRLTPHEPRATRYASMVVITIVNETAMP